MKNLLPLLIMKLRMKNEEFATALNYEIKNEEFATALNYEL